MLFKKVCYFCNFNTGFITAFAAPYTLSFICKTGKHTANNWAPKVNLKAPTLGLS